MPDLKDWDNFYLLVAGAAGALIGLQFVVITLIAGRQIVRMEATAAYATPTVIHFSTALLLSAALLAPWQSVASPTAICFIIGVSGTAYSAIVARRMRRSTYEPVFEDWLFHCLLPLVTYAMLAAAAYELPFEMHAALFGVGGAVLLLLFIGIHNAWDTIAYQVSRDPEKTSSPPKGE